MGENTIGAAPAAVPNTPPAEGNPTGAPEGEGEKKTYTKEEVEQLLQHRCIVCHNPAGQRKDALGLEDVLAHLLVVDLHLDHVRTGL